jgi:hypothetical protein
MAGKFRKPEKGERKQERFLPHSTEPAQTPTPQPKKTAKQVAAERTKQLREGEKLDSEILKTVIDAARSVGFPEGRGGRESRKGFKKTDEGQGRLERTVLGTAQDYRLDEFGKAITKGEGRLVENQKKLAKNKNFVRLLADLDEGERRNLYSTMAIETRYNPSSVRESSKDIGLLQIKGDPKRFMTIHKEGIKKANKLLASKKMGKIKSRKDFLNPVYSLAFHIANRPDVIAEPSTRDAYTLHQQNVAGSNRLNIIARAQDPSQLIYHRGSEGGRRLMSVSDVDDLYGAMVSNTSRGGSNTIARYRKELRRAFPKGRRRISAAEMSPRQFKLLKEAYELWAEDTDQHSGLGADYEPTDLMEAVEKELKSKQRAKNAIPFRGIRKQ